MELLSGVGAYLPPAVLAAAEKLKREDIEEIRLRSPGESTATCGGENLPLGFEPDKGELDRLLLRLCGGSLYAHSATLRQGYVTLPCGVRVGISGRAVREGGEVTGITDVTSLVFRIPRSVRGCGEYPARLLRRDPGRGLLIFSRPGVGKTTVLRDVCRILSTGASPLRLAVVDTRDEICKGERFGTVDVLRGFGRSEGIELAVRTLSPELVVCDEIGSEADARAILSTQRAGIPLLATAHAGSVGDLESRPATAALRSAGIFSYYLGLTRRGGQVSFSTESVCGLS